MAIPKAARVGTVLLVLLLLAPVTAAGSEPAEDREDRGSTWTWDDYHTWDMLEPEMRNLTRTYSSIAVMYDLGVMYPHGDGSPRTTWEGRNFWAIKVSDNPHLNETGEPRLLYVGLHHGRERMTVEFMMYFLTNVLEGYGTNATLTDIVDNRELWFFPVLNPDGYVKNEQTDWRKNMRDNGDGTFGVDPNRNYGYEWGYDDIGSDPNPGSETYRGPYPFSEPCTQIMRDFALDKGFVGAISFHTWQDVILYPIAYKRAHADHYAIMRELARRMAEHNGYEYGDVLDGILYTVNGGWDDFMYFNASTLCFTFEMNSREDGRFWPPPELILPTCQENYEPAIILARYADDYYKMWEGGIDAVVVDPRGEPQANVTVHVGLLGDDALDFVTGPDGRFSFHAPPDIFYQVSVEKEGYSSWSGGVQVRWPDRMTPINITITDVIPPSIVHVEASHQGHRGTEFGIGQTVRIDVWEEQNETGLDGWITIESFHPRYALKRKPLTHDDHKGSYFYIWETAGLDDGDEYTVTTEMADIDGNRDKDGVQVGQPDLRLTLRDITPPTVPANLSVTAPEDGGTLVLTWEANTDDTQVYTLHRRRDDVGDWALLINLTVGETTFTDQGLENGRTYWYRLMAWDDVMLPSGWSEPASGTPRDLVPPGLVSGFSITAPPDGGRLVLSWQKSTDDTAVYIVYKSDGIDLRELVVLPRDVTELEEVDLENGLQYMYRISARDASGNEGPLSPPMTGRPQDTTSPSLPQPDQLPELTNLSEHQVSGTAEAGATVVVVVNQEEAGQFEVLPDGTFTGTITMGNGVNRVTFKCYDLSLNPSGATEAQVVHVDLNAPRVTSSEPSDGQFKVPVDQTLVLYVSEALLDGSVDVRLVYASTGVKVGSSFQYSGVSKSITVYSSSELEKGTEYRLVAEGMDAAGNHLEDGMLVFTTVPKPLDEPTISSTMLALVIAVVLAAIVMALLLVRRSRGEDGEGDPGPHQGWGSQTPPENDHDEVGSYARDEEPYEGYHEGGRREY